MRTVFSFYARTVNAILPRAKPDGESAERLNLWINSDADFSTGWHGFELRVNRVPLTPTTTSVEAWRAGHWETVGAARVQIGGREIEISLPRTVLENLKNELSFKWTDNTAIESDILTTYRRGDSAPNGRFAYRYFWDDAK